ncbi:MAG: sugar transferase [Phycisphaeraceae bacterium]
MSGRSETTLEQRLALDALYVRSWSIWLDLSILLQTSFAILGGKGAY